MDNPIVFDVETVELQPDGSTRASTEYYRENFRVLSCAFTERVNGEVCSWYVDGEDTVREELTRLGNRPLIAHNIQFEMGVCKCRFPTLSLNFYCDTMRLVQNYDNGGADDDFERIVLDPEDFDEDELAEEANIKYKPLQGFGLVVSCKRILGLDDHKKEAHDWIYANVPEARKGKAGQYLDRLPRDILERYNVLDTERTLALYEHITESFARSDFDWGFDHGLYLSTVVYVVDAKIRGVLVERDRLLLYGEQVVKEMEAIAAAFQQRYAAEIAKVERTKLLEEIRTRKTLRGRKKYIQRVRNKEKAYHEDIAFNVGSNDQLAMLFVNVLNMVPKFFTATGKPSFKSTMLSQWGDGGEMLGKRRKRLLVLKQVCNLLKVSEYDARYHIDLKCAGTSTGRAAGGNHL